MPDALTPLHSRIDEMAQLEPQFPAIVEVESGNSIDYLELADRSRWLARDLMLAGVDQGDFVAICLTNSIDFYLATVAAWRIGATPQPLSYRLTVPEVIQAVDLSGAPVLITDRTDLGLLGQIKVLSAQSLPGETDLEPDRISQSWKALSSGGSTGKPKLIVAGQPAAVEVVLPLASVLGMRQGGSQLVTAPMSHNGPFVFSMLGLLQGATQVVAGRFDPEKTLAYIQMYQIEWLYSVPTMMQRMVRLDESIKRNYSLDSLKTIFHTAAPCPESVKRAWIEWIGPAAVLELYAGTEAQAITLIDGREWLEHPGSVGRPLAGQFKVLDPEGLELPPGCVGEVFMRPNDLSRPTYRYIGADRRERDGWESLGDMGFLDEAGYLFLADRQIDMILVGGLNVYPAEVEAVILDHPSVLSCCVVGVPAGDLGQVPYALVQLREPPVSLEELEAHLRSRLVPYKIPRRIDFVEVSLRDDTGKVRRSSVRDELLRTLATEQGVKVDDVSL